MRPPLQFRALVLTAADRGEDDRLLGLLTPERGRVTALARRARGSRRRFGAALEPFRLVEAALRPTDGGLFFLEGAATLEAPLGVDPGFDEMASAWLCLELAAAFAVADHPQVELFELVLGGLRRLGLRREGAAAVRQSVLWGTLALSGWAPDLERCAACGSPGPWAGVALDADRGGLLCGKCLPPGGRALPGSAAEHWAALARGLPAGAGEDGAEAALLRFVERHAGRPLRSAAALAPGPGGA